MDVGFAIVAVFGIITFCLSLVITSQKEVAVIQRFGKFVGLRRSGLTFKTPFIDWVAYKQSLRIDEISVDVETITKDKVSVHITVAVQYYVEDKDQSIINSVYELSDFKSQIKSYVFDSLRAEVPRKKLDEVYENKEDLEKAVKGQLSEAIESYGYIIQNALVVDIDPDASVKEAMNRINAAEREKVAAQYEGDAARILIVEKAKAEAESKRLQGQGIADQRREIARGLEESVDVLNGVGINSQEASALIVVTQHYDTLQSIGEHTNSNLILLPNSPQAGSDMLNNMVASFTASNQIGEAMKESNERKKNQDK